MNYRELYQNLLDLLYQSMTNWLLILGDVEGTLTDSDESQKFKEQVNDLQRKGYLWVEQLDHIRCDLDSNKIQDEIQASEILNRLHNLLQSICLLEITQDDQEKQENQHCKELEDLNAQLKYAKRKAEDLKQLTIDNDKELDKLREEKEERISEINKLEKNKQDINNKLKEQKEEITTEGDYSKELDKKTLHTKDRIKKLKEKSDIIQQYLESIKKQNIKKENILAELKQKEIDEKDRSKILKNQIASMDSDSEIEELVNIKPNVIRQEDHINQIGEFTSLKDEFNEVHEDMSQNESLDQEDSTQSLQDCTISSTIQEEVLSKETQTLNVQKGYNKIIGYTVFFTIPFALTGVSLTFIPLVKSTENNTIFLSVGLSFSTLAIICLVTIALYSYCGESTADLRLPKKLSDNFIETPLFKVK